MTTLRQQVNLYQPEAERQRGPLGADTLVVGSTAVVVAILLAWGVGTWRMNRVQQAVQGLQAQQQRAAEALGALGAVDASSANSSDVSDRVRELGVELAAREQALRLLQAGSVGRTSGFSGQLAALARRPVSGLWLRRISISAVGNSMSLAGEVLEPDLVPRYLRGLATERDLSGLRFDRLVIEMKPPVPAQAKSGRSAPHSAFTFRADGVATAVMRIAGAGKPSP